MRSYTRKYLRAPLHSDFLYTDQKYLLKGKIQNISQGGMGLGQLSKLPPALNKDGHFLDIMFKLPLYPDLSHVDTKYLNLQEFSDISGVVIQAKIEIVRKMVNDELLDGLFYKEIGCRFVELEARAKQLIAEYVASFSQNMIFLLHLFEEYFLVSSPQKKIDIDNYEASNFETNKDQKEVLNNIKFCAKLLGYEVGDQLSQLRSKLLHEYQSLKNL